MVNMNNKVLNFVVVGAIIGILNNWITKFLGGILGAIPLVGTLEIPGWFSLSGAIMTGLVVFLALMVADKMKLKL